MPENLKTTQFYCAPSVGAANKAVIFKSTNDTITIPKGALKADKFQGNEIYNADGTVKPGANTMYPGETFTNITPPSGSFLCTFTFSTTGGESNTDGTLVITDPHLKKVIVSETPKEEAQYAKNNPGIKLEDLPDHTNTAVGWFPFKIVK